LLRRASSPARILLVADEHKTDVAMAIALHVHPAPVERPRRRFVAGRITGALNEKPRPGGRPKLDRNQEALLMALACSTPAAGRGHWTVPLLADRLVALGPGRPSATRRCAAPSTPPLKPWPRKQGCIAAVGADFVWRMEDGLDLSAEPSAADRLLGVLRRAAPAAIGRDAAATGGARPARIDDEDRRAGTVNLYLCFEPLTGWRPLEVTQPRSNQDFARQMRDRVEVHPR
jgi:hypothetical protein